MFRYRYLNNEQMKIKLDVKVLKSSIDRVTDFNGISTGFGLF